MNFRPPSLFRLTLFLSAFLLFWCEPLIAKILLPDFGGSASVWVTSVVFFQIILVAAYVYAHLLAKFAAIGKQFFVHLTMMLAAGLVLPLHFIHGEQGASLQDPLRSLLVRLFFGAGLPFFVLSAAAPLLQSWFSRAKLKSSGNPYALYAASNFGSLSALLAFPFIFEPVFGIRIQTILWAALYAGLSFLILGIAIGLHRNSSVAPDPAKGMKEPKPPEKQAYLRWVAAAFVPAALLLAVTSHISVNVVSLPLFWIAPLFLYLLTLVLVFGMSQERLGPHVDRLRGVFPIVALFILWIVPPHPPQTPGVNSLLVGGHLLVLLFAAWLCHSILAVNRPGVRYLTGFYLAVAVGGALGGLFSAIAAPKIFKTVVEYPLLVSSLGFFCVRKGGKKALAAATAFAVVLLPLSGWRERSVEAAQRVYVVRNFFGVKKVLFDSDRKLRKLYHGDTLHGVESTDPAMSGEPSSYYHRGGPAGDVIAMLKEKGKQTMGVVGLGAGTMAAYAGPDLQLTFFEIDPQVVSIARDFFTYLQRCGSNCNVVVADGRLAITRAPDDTFDVLMFDAFSSDAIPPHLISQEALHIYMSKLKPNGLLLFHVSSRYLDTGRLVAANLSAAGLPAFFRRAPDEDFPLKSGSDYLVAARRLSDFGPILRNASWHFVLRDPELQPWTDDFSNVLSVVRWR